MGREEEDFRGGTWWRDVTCPVDDDGGGGVKEVVELLPSSYLGEEEETVVGEESSWKDPLLSLRSLNGDC